MSKNPLMPLAYTLIRGVARSFTFLAERLPRRWALRVGEWLGALAYYVVPRHRRVAMDNLRLALGGEKSAKELKSIARGVYRHWGRSGMETLRLWGFPRRGLDAVVEVQGGEYLAAAARGGKGVVLAIPHLGCFTILGMKIRLDGYNLEWIMRMPRDTKLLSWLNQLLHNAGVKIIDDANRLRAVKDSMRALRQGAVLGVAVDQNSGGGVFVNFFGRQAATATGAATLALRCASVLLPVYIYWKSPTEHCLVVEKPLTTEKSNFEEAVADLTAQVTARVEEWARRYPQQWLWLHRRWKTRPPEERAAAKKEAPR